MDMTKSKKKALVGRTLHYFFGAQWHHKGLVIGAFASTPLVIFCRDVFLTYFIADIIAKVTANPSLDYVQQVLVPEAIFVIVIRIIFSDILGELRVYWCWKMEIYAMYRLSNLCFNAVAEQSMQFHNERFSGSLVSQTNKFVSAYERFMDNVIWSIIPLFTTIISAEIILFSRVPLFATGMLIFIVLYIAIAYLAFRKITPLNLRQADSENRRTGQLADSITNILSVKSYANEKHERKRFDSFNKKVIHATTNLLRADIKRNIGFDIIYFSITVATLVFLLAGQGVFGVTLGTLLLVFQYTNTIANYLWNFNNIFKDMNRVFGDAKEMTEILDMQDEVTDLEGAKPLKVTDAKIDFSNITFRHADAKSSIFENFSLDIKPGERIGLVGVSGSGKTTLTKLLLRFADVKDGSIMIDGQDIKKVTQESLRSSIAYVPQETALFHRSISENIGYGKPNATKEEIERAAKLANAHDFIKDLPEGYDTMVGERGVKLSGGQRQRIAIARAILKMLPF